MDLAKVLIHILKNAICFLSSTEFKYCTVLLQIQRPGFDSRGSQSFWEVMGLEQGPLSLVSTTEELLEIKSSGSGLENRDYICRDSSRWQRGTIYPQQLTLTSSTSGGRPVGIVRLRTQAMDFSLVIQHYSMSTALINYTILQYEYIPNQSMEI
jgi:hypothetical protein